MLVSTLIVFRPRWLVYFACQGGGVSVDLLPWRVKLKFDLTSYEDRDEPNERLRSCADEAIALLAFVQYRVSSGTPS